MHQLNYTGLTDQEITWVEEAIESGDGNNLVGYIPEQKLAFVLRNFRRLAELGVLERNWMTAYVHASHLNDYPLALLQEVFDTCDRALLRELYPIPDSHTERLSLFRGCAGPNHRMGMSWTTSLDKAIWYAAQHAEYRGLANRAVYAATVDRSEIYCRGHDHYEPNEFIVLPSTWWHVDVPASEFRLDRPRW
jgi:hypothetical protein